jgi:signal transduction histidine kinase
MTAQARQVRIHLVDVVVAGVLLLFGLVGTGPAGANQAEVSVPPDPFAYVLVVVAAAMLVAWRRLPAQVFVAIGLVIAVYLARGYPFGPVLFTGILAAGGLAARRPLRLVVSLAAVDVVVVGVALVVRATVVGSVGWFSVVAILLALTVWVALPVAIGVAMRVRREAGVRVRSEQARRAVSEERLRMAQEVHDVVGHGLAVIAMQAGAGLHILDRNPEKAREALQAIQATSRESLDGLRAELAALRGDAAEDEGGPDTSPRTPRAGLADIERLVQRVRSGGLDVRLEQDDPTTPLSPEVELAAYRIVQESLTNVLKHAGPAATARVRIRLAHGRVLLDVSDTGDGLPAGKVDEGSGIGGMRVRARELGGSLEVLSRPGGGVQVTASLPATIGAEEVAP